MMKDVDVMLSNLSTALGYMGITVLIIYALLKIAESSMNKFKKIAAFIMLLLLLTCVIAFYFSLNEFLRQGR